MKLASIHRVQTSDEDFTFYSWLYIGIAIINEQGSFITGVLSAARQQPDLSAALLLPSGEVLNYCSLIYALSANGKEYWKMIQDPRKQQEIGTKAMDISLLLYST